MTGSAKRLQRDEREVKVGLAMSKNSLTIQFFKTIDN